MALTLTTAARNAAADAIADLLDAGTADAQGDMVIKTGGGSTLATISLQNPAFGAAASGVVTLAGVPLTATASATGTAATFDLVDRDNTVVVSGTVGTSGSGADAIIDSTAITSGDTVQLNSLTLTMPAS